MLNNWDNLRHFLALARTGSPEGAGRLLKVDESTIRRRLATLEKEAGATLFERTDEGWQLTRAGTMLLHSAEHAEEAIARGQADIDGNDPALAGTVRVGAPDGFGGMVVVPSLVHLQRRAPELVIELVTDGSPTDLARREVDLQVIVQPPENGRHRIRKLRPVTLQLFAARGYLADAPPIGDVADLAAHPLVGYDPASDFAETAVRQLTASGIAISSRFICSSVFAQARAAAAGAGLALLPGYMVDPGMDLVTVLPDEVSITIDLWLLTHVDVAGRARVRAVADAIAEGSARAK